MRFIVWFVICSIGIAVAACQPQRNYKDREEYDVYNDVTKDFEAKTFLKALTDLERWSEKYPDSAFKDDRQILYVQAYAGAEIKPRRCSTPPHPCLPTMDSRLPIQRACSACYMAAVSAIQHVT